MTAVLCTDGLTVRHGGVVALDAVDLEVPEGSVVGLIGPNGAGKTTFVDAVCGFVRPTHGRVVLDGRDVTRLAPHRRVRAGMARTFQSGELFDDLTVAENLTVAAHQPSWRTTLRDALPLRASDAHVAPILDHPAVSRLGLDELADRFPPELSHGDRQLVALGRALAAQPRIVVLDEPAAGLGPDETDRLATVVRGLPATGVSVLLVDHDMGLVMSVCDRVEVLDFGRRIAGGTPDEVRSDELVLDAYLGGGS